MQHQYKFSDHSSVDQRFSLVHETTISFLTIALLGYFISPIKNSPKEVSFWWADSEFSRVC